MNNTIHEGWKFALQLKGLKKFWHVRWVLPWQKWRARFYMIRIAIGEFRAWTCIVLVFQQHICMQCASMDMHQVFSKGRPISGLPCYANVHTIIYSNSRRLQIYRCIQVIAFTSHALIIDEKNVSDMIIDWQFFFLHYIYKRYLLSSIEISSRCWINKTIYFNNY